MSKSSKCLHPDPAAFWRLAIRLWQDSGMSVSQFCKYVSFRNLRNPVTLWVIFESIAVKSQKC